MADQHRVPRVRTVWWQQEGPDGQEAAVCLLDQSQLPQQMIFLRLTHEQQVATAITDLKVRGAPVIGVTAAFGLALAAQRFLRQEVSTNKKLAVQDMMMHLEQAAHLLRQTRPTAVNLSWALERLLKCANRAIEQSISPSSLVQLLCDEAQAIADEDVQACWSMGRYGAEVIADGDTLLTHCNAGILATVGWGTALSPIYVAHLSGKRIHVFVDETRPVLQGARLTAWELQQEDVPLTLITDSMAGHFMRQGSIKAVFVGADRIAANGDVANKIGTYSLAVLAQAHHIPLYVVAPCSTVDLSLPSGESIPIEQRSPYEVTTLRGQAIAPSGIQVANPAFDVTPQRYVTAIITEKGLLRPPYGETLHRACLEDSHPGKV